MEDVKTIFNELNKINVNEHVEKKNTGNTSLSYLSWTWALQEVLKRYPDTTWEVRLFDGKPYIYDENTGYMVFTRVTINNVTREMWLPVMDGRNQAMLNHRVEHKTKTYTYYTEPASMFDINKTIMRCLTKNLAVFGLGLYIYAGEDLPTEEPLTEEDKDKALQDIVLSLEQYNDVLSTDQKQKVDVAIREKNLRYLQQILSWCKTKK